MLVLIGPTCLDISDAQGRRRLDDSKDWIRQEISTALRLGIRVVPVLIDGSPPPDESALSDDLKPLVRRQALESSDSRWRGDLQRLVETLAKLPGLALQKPGKDAEPPKSKKKMWIGIVVGVLVLVEVATYLPNSANTNTNAPPLSPPVQPEVPLTPAQPFRRHVPGRERSVSGADVPLRRCDLSAALRQLYTF